MYIHYTYKIINNTNDKEYIGVHSTKDLDDGYMGSGRILQKAFKKYGMESFTKEIVSFHDTRELALEHEYVLVDDDYVLRSDTYNMIRGGMEGFAPGSPIAMQHSQMLRDYYKDKTNHPMYGKTFTDAQLANIKRGRDNMSPEKRAKIGAHMRGVQPWSNAKGTDDTQRVWASMEIIERVWEDCDRCGYNRLAAIMAGGKHVQVFKNIIIRLDAGWDYMDDVEWVDFKSVFGGGLLVEPRVRKARKWEYPRARRDLWDNADSYYDLKAAGLSPKDIMDIFIKEGIICTRAQLYPIDEMIRGGWNPYDDSVWCLYQQGLTDGRPLTYYKK